MHLFYIKVLAPALQTTKRPDLSFVNSSCTGSIFVKMTAATTVKLGFLPPKPVSLFPHRSSRDKVKTTKTQNLLLRPTNQTTDNFHWNTKTRTNRNTQTQRRLWPSVFCPLLVCCHQPNHRIVVFRKRPIQIHQTFNVQLKSSWQPNQIQAFPFLAKYKLELLLYNDVDYNWL